MNPLNLDKSKKAQFDNLVKEILLAKISSGDERGGAAIIHYAYDMAEQYFKKQQ